MNQANSPYLFSPLFYILILSGITGLFSGIYLLRFRKSSGSLYLSLMQFATALWAFFYGMEYASTILSEKIFWSKLSYLGIIFAPIFFYFFSLHFATNANRDNKKLKTVLITVGVLFLLLVATNDLHTLHWQSYRINAENNTMIYHYGISFWLVFAFNYVLLALSIINIFPLAFRFSDHFHIPIFLLLTACFFLVIGNVMYVFNVSPIPGFDWTPIFFVFSGIIFTYLNLRYGTFRLIPIARNKLIDILPDGILVVDNQLQIADANPSFLELTQQKREAIIGKLLGDAFQKRKSLIEQLAQKNEITPVELESDIGGEKKYFDIRASSLYDQKKNLTGRLIVLRDITEKTMTEHRISKTNQQLIQEISEKEKLIADLDAFDHTVAHDLNNIIGAIVTSSEMMQYELEHMNYENLGEITELIKLSANKSFHVVKELLTLASVRKQDIKTNPLDMDAVFAESEKRVNDMIKESNATIIKPKEWPSANGYAPWIEEVWVNFLSNAIKYGGKPPVIELGANQFYSDKKVRYWIKDNGNGLTKEKQKKLFKQYKRFNQSHIEGHGLGLSIVKRIIEKLDGEVGVISNSIPGEGCMFYFTLPCN